MAPKRRPRRSSGPMAPELTGHVPRRVDQPRPGRGAPVRVASGPTSWRGMLDGGPAPGRNAHPTTMARSGTADRSPAFPANCRRGSRRYGRPRAGRLRRRARRTRAQPRSGRPARATRPDARATATADRHEVTQTKLASGVVVPTAPWLIAENQRPGTLDWIVNFVQPDHALEGFASQVSAVSGRRCRPLRQHRRPGPCRSRPTAWATTRGSVAGWSTRATWCGPARNRRRPSARHRNRQLPLVTHAELQRWTTRGPRGATS